VGKAWVVLIKISRSVSEWLERRKQLIPLCLDKTKLRPISPKRPVVLAGLLEAGHRGHLGA